MTLNRAVAVSKVRGPLAALAMIEPLEQRLSGYFHFFGLKGGLLMQLDRGEEARIAFDRAIALANTRRKRPISACISTADEGRRRARSCAAGPLSTVCTPGSIVPCGLRPCRGGGFRPETSNATPRLCLRCLRHGRNGARRRASGSERDKYDDSAGNGGAAGETGCGQRDAGRRRPDRAQPGDRRADRGAEDDFSRRCDEDHRCRAQGLPAWRMVPGPRRGELVRLLGEELRAHKAELGRLVSIEVGKIPSEGLGESRR